VHWLSHDYTLGDPGATHNHLAVMGLTLAVMGYQLFAFTLILHGSILATTRRRPNAAD
jgi:hypothetical protein